MHPLHPLRHRRSTPSRLLTVPGPDDSQLAEMLACAVRVPDHGKLTGVSFRPLQAVAPIVWKGDVAPPAAATPATPKKKKSS